MHDCPISNTHKKGTESIDQEGEGEKKWRKENDNYKFETRFNIKETRFSINLKPTPEAMNLGLPMSK